MTELKKASESAVDQFALTFNLLASAIQNGMRFVAQGLMVLSLCAASGFALLDKWLSKPGWPELGSVSETQAERR